VSFEEMEAYMESRNKLFAFLQRQELTDEHREQCRPYAELISQHRAVIEERMYQLKEAAAMQLIKVASGKKQQQAYNPEQEIDSVFFDKKR
jgi:hypothetical protein